MRVPLSWLRDYAPFDRPLDELAAALSGLGLVVDGVEVVGEDLDHVVVALILAIRTHPDAERIRLVDVDAGDGQPLQIACGAWNMHVGDLVPLAEVGAVLPGGMTIGRRKMRGEWSNGMLCAPGEIGRPEPDGHDGLLILPPGIAAPGTPIAEALGGPDVVFDLDVSPNRPDAFSVAGVARDLAAHFGLPWAWPTTVPGQAGSSTEAGPTRQGVTGEAVAVDATIGRASLRVDDPDLCGRFTATVLTGVVVGPSPAWLAERLQLAGMRPINNVVDVSNYVMLDTGQPNHAYDLDRLAGGGLIVRRARAGETLVTLDGVARSFVTDDLLICDGESAPVGVAGIMGGASSEISATTTSVLLEAAWFEPTSVARSGIRLGVTSEARHRFERGVDPELAPRAVARFAQLLAAVTPGAGVGLGPTIDAISESDLPGRDIVDVRTARVNAVLGVALDDGDIAGLLAPIGFTVSAAVDGAAGVQTVTVPTWRPDTTREIDVIEEIARHHGYPSIARTLPAGARAGGGLTRYQSDRRRVRDILVGAGLDEAWTTTFLAPEDLQRAGLPADAVAVENPLDHAESILRTALLPGLLEAARLNAGRQQPDVGLFEIGRVFDQPAAGTTTPTETEMLAVLVGGVAGDARVVTRIWSVLRDALGLDGTGLEAAQVAGMHPTRTARIDGADGVALGAVGEVDPEVSEAYGLGGRVGYLGVDLGRLLSAPRRARSARPISRYPASDMDLAFVVAETVPAAALAATLRTAGGDLLEGLELFDVFRGPQLGSERRSLAFRLRLRARDRTLADHELAATRQAVIEAVVVGHGAELRA